MDINFWQILLQVWLVAALVMIITWMIQLKTKDASYVDVVWALGIGAAATYTLIFYTDLSIRKFIIFICPLFWSLRLGYYLCKRLVYLQEEDSRYQTMRAAMGEKVNIGFFLFFQVQAVFIVLFSAPIIIALTSTSNQFSLIDFIGIVIFIIAFVGESIADRQLLQHKKNNGPLVTCQSGLWFYSRHPNYFFEWLHWFSYACFSFYSVYFYITLAAPFLMLFFIVYLTGIPHVEREALRKKLDYAEYKKNTPVLIPNIFKK